MQEAGGDADTRTKQAQNVPGPALTEITGHMQPSPSGVRPQKPFEKFLLSALRVWVPVLALSPSCSSWGRVVDNPRHLHDGSQLPDSKCFIQTRQSF